MLEKLREHLEKNPNSFVEYLQQIEDNKQRGIDRISRFIDSIESNEIDYNFNKFLKWEKEYEQMMYKKGILTNSNIFDSLMDYMETKCDRHLSLQEDFVADAFIWRNYTFKLYIGQGSFWKILKDNKQIF